MTTKLCPACGGEILAVAKKCKHCGEWIAKQEVAKETIACPICSEQIEVGTELCPHCKERVAQPASTSKNQTTTQPPDLTHGRSKTPYVQEDKTSLFQTYFIASITRQYADFGGAMSRKGYWFSVLFYSIGLIAASSLDMIFGLDMKIEGESLIVGWIPLAYTAVLIVPGIAAVVRRLRDAGRKPAWVLVALIPVIGSIWLLVLLCGKGESRETSKWAVPDSVFIGLTTLLLILSVSIDANKADTDINHEHEVMPTDLRSYFEQNIGKAPSDIFDNPLLVDRLTQLVGKEGVEIMKALEQVVSPIDKGDMMMGRVIMYSYSGGKAHDVADNNFQLTYYIYMDDTTSLSVELTIDGESYSFDEQK